MKKGGVIKVIIYLIVSLCSLSCGTGIYEIISRTQDDPDDFSIRVDSFSEENNIKCSWEKDDSCDSYILMRSEDIEDIRFKEVYAGEECYYEDKVLKPETRYLYRLDKKRGKLKFKGGVYYMGVYSKNINDIYEPNDKASDAELLLNDKQSNLYYYRSFNGSILEDEDWYKITLNGKWMCSIVLVYAHDNTPFCVTMPYNWHQEYPVSNKAIVIKNDTGEKKEICFKVSINKSLVPGTAGAGVFLSYTIRLTGMTPISP